jgi:hypothetical protein
MNKFKEFNSEELALLGAGLLLIRDMIGLRKVQPLIDDIMEEINGPEVEPLLTEILGEIKKRSSEAQLNEARKLRIMTQSRNN